MRGFSTNEIVIEDNIIDSLETYQSVFRGDVPASYSFRNNSLINVYARVAMFDINIASTFELNDTYIHSSANGMSTIFNFGPLA